MSDAYDLVAWHGFFVVQVGFVGGLFGLMIVALTLRIDTFRSDRALLASASTGPILLMAICIATLIGIMPGQTRILIGVETLILTISTAGLLAWIMTRHALWTYVGKGIAAGAVLLAVSVVPLLAGEIGLITHSMGGFVTLTIGYLCLIISSTLSVWETLAYDLSTVREDLESRIEAEVDSRLASKVSPELIQEINAAVEEAVDSEFRHDV